MLVKKGKQKGKEEEKEEKEKKKSRRASVCGVRMGCCVKTKKESKGRDTVFLIFNIVYRGK